MEKITLANIEKEISNIIENKPMTCDNLERFVLLSKAMKYMKHVHRHFTEEDAKEWASHMDPPARWTMEQTTAVMQQRGYDHKPCEFYVVMNMLVSDYGKTMAKYSADRPEIWADLAHDFISDKDAVEDKVGRYWRDIVQYDSAEN
jgi:hypothetical protein